MGKAPCKSREHFVRCVTAVEGRKDRITWKCDHCNKHVISGQYKAATARVHLTADKTNGICIILCDSKDNGYAARCTEFRELIVKLKEEKDKAIREKNYRCVECKNVQQR